MNEITKEKVVIAVGNAQDDEKLMNVIVAKQFDAEPVHLTYMRNPKYWNRIPEKVWLQFKDWMYSGKKLKDYKPPVTPMEDKEPVEKEAPANEIKQEPAIRAKPEAKEIREKLSKDRVEWKGVSEGAKKFLKTEGKGKENENLPGEQANTKAKEEPKKETLFDGILLGPLDQETLLNEILHGATSKDALTTKIGLEIEVRIRLKR